MKTGIHGMNKEIESLEPLAEKAWGMVWSRLSHERTSLFYDFASSTEHDLRFEYFPTQGDIARQVPNPNGWGTGMEDSTITGGVLLACVCDRYDATKDLETLRPAAARIFAGLHLCGTKSRAEGFVLRSVSPQDGASYYIETSRDQLTHYAHGLWRYYHSPLSTERERAMMRDLIAALCRRLERYIVPERNYHFCKENDEPGRYDKMWNVDPHEVARLPMIYGVGWELTGDEHWNKLYRSYVGEALKQAATLRPDEQDWCYALFQHQVSLEVLASLSGETEEMRKAWSQQMCQLGQSLARYVRTIRDYAPIDLAQLKRELREPTLVDDGGYMCNEVPALKMERPLRELGEALLIKLMANLALDEEDVRHLSYALTAVDYEKAFCCYMLYPQAAYWRYRANLARETLKRGGVAKNKPAKIGCNKNNIR